LTGLNILQFTDQIASFRTALYENLFKEQLISSENQLVKVIDMGRKKAKKVNPKKERYAKFHKEKSANLDLSMPELDDDQARLKREDESKINRFLKFNKNRPPHEIVERKEKSKR